MEIDMVAKLKNLIARLESANSPDRELDGWIFCAVHHPTQKPSRNPLYKNREEWGVFITKPPASHTTFYDAPLYTASIDAALPGENIVQIKRLTVGHPDGDKWEAVQHSGGRQLTARANTEALARRIASLKARSHGS